MTQQQPQQATQQQPQQATEQQTWPAPNPPDKSLDDLLQAFDENPTGYTPKLFVVRNRGGMQGRSLPHIDVVVGMTRFDVEQQLLRYLDGPTFLLAKMRQLTGDRGGRYTAMVEIDMSDPTWWAQQRAPSTSTSSTPAPAPNLEKLIASAVAQALAGAAGAAQKDVSVVSSDPFSVADKMMERVERMQASMFKELKELLPKTPAPSSPGVAPPTSHEFWLNQGQALATAAAKATPAKGGLDVPALITALSPFGLKLIDVAEKVIEVRETEADARLLILAKANGVDVSELKLKNAKEVTPTPTPTPAASTTTTTTTKTPADADDVEVRA